MDNNTPDLFWVQDGSGLNTCHMNSGGSFNESLIGTLYFHDDGWKIVLKDNTDITPKEGCASYARARHVMESNYRRKNIPIQSSLEEHPIRIVDRKTPRTVQQGKIEHRSEKKADVCNCSEKQVDMIDCPIHHDLD